MKPQERLTLINKIAYKLQEEMSLIDIKSYLFAFSINCSNYKANYNSKRVFVEEVLSSVESKDIIKIGKDLKLISNENKNFEVVINNIYNRCIKEEDFDNVKSFLVFYEEVSPIKLSHLFSFFHFSFNNLFRFMNQKLDVNRHFNADESRELLWLINNLETLLKGLDKVGLKYFIIKEYSEAIDLCKKFLVTSGGSPIPENFKAIEVIEIEPIFILSSIVKVNKYDFETKHIGSGSYAEVLKYKDKFYNKTFAIKKAKSDLVEKELERFKREFEIMQSLNSPYILEVYNYNEEDNSYIMEFADFTIGKYIEKNNTKIQLSQRINIINQLFKAFEYLHGKNILHRDISISNILLKEYDKGVVIKVADFGLVKLKDSIITNDNTEFKGSLNDPNLDVKGGFKNFSIEHETYALTRLIYFIMTGKKTIYENKLSNGNFKKFILDGISNNLSLRYKSIEEMKKVFSKISF